MIYEIGKKNSIFNQFIRELRDKNIQKDSMRFRRNLERIGEIMAYEISKKLNYSSEKITTPLGSLNMEMISDKVIIATILRAGLPLHQGILNYFDGAENAFVTAYRKHHKDGSFDIEIEYLSSPEIDGKTLILNDPMLASGQSMVLAYQAMLTKGIPAHTHIVAIIASTEGIAYVKNKLGKNTTLWIGAIDKELTSQSYIVPGLGDAGDLAFGIKE